MSSSVVKILAVALGVCAAACSHNSQFKKASPAVMAATNMQLAIEYLKLGKLASSQEFMERALSEDPGNPDVQMTAGLVYERVNDIPKAERAYSTGYRLGKKDPNIQNSYAGFLCRTGKAVAGEKLFAAVASNPLYQTPEVALINAGVCVRGTGDLVDAERYFTSGAGDPSEFARGLAAAREHRIRSRRRRTGARDRETISGGESADVRSPLVGGSRRTQAGRCDHGGELRAARAD